MVVNPKAVNPGSIRSYADLANPALKGQLCLRNRKSVYNQSLVADQMILRGDQQAAAWVKAMTANVTQPYFSSDTPDSRRRQWPVRRWSGQLLLRRPDAGWR